MANEKKKWTRDEVSAHVTKLVAEALPVGYIEQCIEDTLKKSLTDFRISDYDVNIILKHVVQERTKEIIKTKYAAQVEARAEELAMKAFASSR